MCNVKKFLNLILIICFSASCFAIDKQTDKVPNNKYPDEVYFKQFQDVFKKIEQDYMKVPNKQEMTDEAIDGMLKSLDPYSGYFTDDDLKFFKDQTDGAFGGIGVEIVYDNGAVKVISPIDDLPAYRAGIKAGDLIIGVNGKLVSNMGFNKSVKEMRGKPGTKLSLLVVKVDEHITKEVELKREIVKIKPIKFEIEQNDDVAIAYVRIVTFNQQTITELKNTVKKIQGQLQQKDKKLEGIILDVRNNPGGLLTQAVAVSEYFIDHGTIVSIRGRDGKNSTTTSAGRFVEKAPNVPMVVLINAGTASAAEIVSGALQDHKRAIIIGTTSFGKGLVQTFAQINKRAAVKLTTAKYYTPSGRSINAKGIMPDIFIENAKVEFAKKEKEKKAFTSSSVKEYLKKYNNEDALDGKDKEQDKEKKDKKKNLSEKYKNDYQYARGYDLIRGLVISNRKNTKNEK